MIGKVKVVIRGASCAIEYTLAMLVLIAGIAAGAALLLYQVYAWLRFGHWESYSFLTLLQWAGAAWATNPDEWYGLHKILGFIPLFLALPAIGALLAAFLKFDADNAEAA